MAVALVIVASLTLLGGCVVGGGESSDPTPLPKAITTYAPEPSPFESSTSSIEIDAEPGVDWPEHCQPDQVAQLLEAFARAINAGDADALMSILPDAEDTTQREELLGTAVADPVAAADAAVALQWLSMPDGDGEFAVIDSVEDIAAFVSHFADGDSLSLQWIKPVPPRALPGIVELGVRATLHTDDGREIALEGKAGIDCSHERVYLWSVGPE